MRPKEVHVSLTIPKVKFFFFFKKGAARFNLNSLMYLCTSCPFNYLASKLIPEEVAFMFRQMSSV